MTPEAIPEIELGPADEAMIADLLMRAFGPDFDGRSYYKQRPHLRLVIRDEGRIVGHMALVMRDIRLGERLCPIAGLAEVATDPERRGAGIASALLPEAIRRSTVEPARVIGRPELGTLGVGSEADVAVLALREGTFGFVDAEGHRFDGSRKLEAEVTIRAGEVVWDRHGLTCLPWREVPSESGYWQITETPVPVPRLWRQS